MAGSPILLVYDRIEQNPRKGAAKFVKSIGLPQSLSVLKTYNEWSTAVLDVKLLRLLITYGL